MSDWREATEDGIKFYLHDTFGNVMELELKDGNKAYIAQMPKIIQLGPFPTSELAKSALVSNRTALDLLIQNFNESLIRFTATEIADPKLASEIEKTKEAFDIKVVKELKE